MTSEDYYRRMVEIEEEKLEELKKVNEAKIEYFKTMTAYYKHLPLRTITEEETPVYLQLGNNFD